MAGFIFYGNNCPKTSFLTQEWRFCYNISMSICIEESDFGDGLTSKNNHNKEGFDVDSSVFLSCFSSNSTLEKQDIRDNNLDKIIDSNPRQDNSLLYSWDISEDPNVVLKQSQIEEFFLAGLQSEEGIQEHIYKNILKYFGLLLSPRFKRAVLEKVYLCKIDHSFKLN